MKLTISDRHRKYKLTLFLENLCLLLKLQIELISYLSTLLYYYLDLILKSGGLIGVWLGARDADVEGTWVWTDGSPGII